MSIILDCAKLDVRIFALAGVVAASFYIPCQAHFLTFVVLGDSCRSAVTHDLQEEFCIWPTCLAKVQTASGTSSFLMALDVTLLPSLPGILGGMLVSD